MVKVQIGWPHGQDYWLWAGHSAPGPRARVGYKVKAADWYIELLQILGDRLGGHPRDAGVEMALDGALASVTGAFDVAVAGLIQACEAYEEQAVKDGRAQSADAPLVTWRYDWNAAKTSYRKRIGGGEVDPFADVDAALSRIPWVG